MIGEPALSDTRRVLVILTKKGALKGCKSGASQLKSSAGELKVNSSLTNSEKCNNCKESGSLNN